MINKLLETVIQKYGPIRIIKVDSAFGHFRIIVENNEKPEFDNCIIAIECFEIEKGLIDLLAEKVKHK